MAISIYKVLSVTNDPNYSDGSQLAEFVLDDGVSKKRCRLGGLPNDNANARTAILAVGQQLFDEGKNWAEAATNIESPAKTFLDNLPSLAAAETAVNNITDLAGAKAVMLKMARAIYALKEMEGV